MTGQLLFFKVYMGCRSSFAKQPRLFFTAFDEIHRRPGENEALAAVEDVHAVVEAHGVVACSIAVLRLLGVCGIKGEC